MKTHVLIVALVLISVAVWGQENMVTLSYGWASTNPEGYDENANGFRINGLYEFNPSQGKFAHGLNIGYVLTKNDEEAQGVSTSVSFRSWPVYYAPKVLLGKSEKFKFFLKGALGVHFSKFKSDGPIASIETTDTGFYGGAGAGGMLFLKENIFLNLEYEWAYQSNTYYGNAFLNTAQLGIGFKF